MQAALILQMVFSPIWPLGENPFPGAPFLIVNKYINQAAVVLTVKSNQLFQSEQEKLLS